MCHGRENGYVAGMGHATAAELQVVLEGVPLPASKQELIGYAQSQDAGERVLAALRGVPEREYAYLDELGEALAPVQPDRGQSEPETPREDSDAVPGGEDYTRIPSDTGKVRDMRAATRQQQRLG